VSEAIAGFIGAGVGAITTVGTQGTLAWLDRRNASRTAARLLHGDLLEARDIMIVSLRSGGWSDKRDLAHVVDAWQERREAIARALRTQDFHDVAGAFKAVEFFQLVRERNTAEEGQGFALARGQMEDAIPRCDEARLILARAGCGWWERYVTLRPRKLDPQPLYGDMDPRRANPS
jgi:hypothetical protein